MSATELHCPDGERLGRLRAIDPPPVNAIDWIEVLPSMRVLAVHCLADVGALDAANVLIAGGERIAVHVTEAARAFDLPAGRLEPDDQAALDESSPTPADRRATLVVFADSSGDASTYELRIVADVHGGGHHADFDPILHANRFSFRVDCPTPFDCEARDACVDADQPGPRIDYLAKDYASFRRLMLDRLALTVPDWTERSPADVGVALVEAVAYAADRVSYHQDAAGTEAYLATARLRPSLRRHARLVDYRPVEGRAARVWLCLQARPGADGAVVVAGTRVVPHGMALPAGDEQGALEQLVAGGATIFETLHDREVLSARNALAIHDWHDGRCCLPAGATSATLLADAMVVGLEAGDVLVLERVGDDGESLSADSQRHAVRLMQTPVAGTDPVDGSPVTEIRWHPDDRLPFALTLDDADGPVAGAVARANVVLAEHGLTIEQQERLVAPSARRFRPRLAGRDITHAAPYDDAAASGAGAVHALRPPLAAVLPAVWLQSEGSRWGPEPDLLRTGPAGRRFTVEMEHDRRARLRFGDGVNGRRPGDGQTFEAHYRVGSGTAGNIGPERLGTLVPAATDVTARNPLPAVGGIGPEPDDQVRLDAPQAFRVPQRAVTEADYAAVTERHPAVERAVATRRWTGSWHTMFVTIDRIGGAPVDADFEERIRAHLERFRMAGYDLEVDGPRYVALDLALSVCAAPGFVAADVELALIDALSARRLPGGRAGVFHADRLTFGEPVYLSTVVAAAMAVDGVLSVRSTRFQRWRELPAGELEAGVAEMGRLEIARLDNDPSAPELGSLELEVDGGS